MLTINQLFTLLVALGALVGILLIIYKLHRERQKSLAERALVQWIRGSILENNREDIIIGNINLNLKDECLTLEVLYLNHTAALYASIQGVLEHRHVHTAIHLAVMSTIQEACRYSGIEYVSFAENHSLYTYSYQQHSKHIVCS